ncbi:MAG: CaiB/BaiF CoA transferase family protein [Streptosporangiaceae bacterium]
MTDFSGHARDPEGGPLRGVRVVDFTTLLPGPLATLLLAEAGADVIKVERPPRGDEMRSYPPRFGSTSANFALLNRGKRSVEADLKDPAARDRVRRLIADADVLVEQFRPGVMERLGLGCEDLREANPRLIYCSITGYGQQGPRARQVGHDLTYLAETGVLDLTRDGTGAPVIPPVLIADIAGGAYPAVMNILLALRRRDATGEGTRLDVSMAANLFPLQYWALANAGAAGVWPRPGAELVTGGSPRYRLYRTADGAWLAAAPLEQHFWERFCELLDLPEGLRDDATAAEATIEAVAERVAAHDAAYWQRRLEGLDVCCTLVRTLEEAVGDPHFAERLRGAGQVASGDDVMPALSLPLDPSMREPTSVAPPPELGEHTSLLEGLLDEGRGDGPRKER